MSECDEKQLKWKIEIDLLEFYGMKVGINCFLFDYEVEYEKNLYSIHTFSAGEADSPILFLLHGFGIANVHFCRVYKELIKKFRVFSIDLPGMGYSSKENIIMDTKEEALNFFVGTISKFIQELLPGKKVIIGGHSFGGYIATHLLIQFPGLFQQLYLLSPAGLTHYDDNQIRQLLDTTNLPFWRKMFFKYAQSKWSEQFTLVTLKTKWYGNFCINMYISKRLHLTGKEYDLWQAYMHDMLSLPNGSEKALFILLNYPKVFAKERYSIEYLLTENYKKIKDTQIFIYFGESDWMDQKGANNLQNNTQIQNIIIRKINNTSHQLNFLNPQGFLEQFFNDSKQFQRENQDMNEILFN